MPYDLSTNTKILSLMWEGFLILQLVVTKLDPTALHFAIKQKCVFVVFWLMEGLIFSYR